VRLRKRFRRCARRRYRARRKAGVELAIETPENQPLGQGILLLFFAEEAVRDANTTFSGTTETGSTVQVFEDTTSRGMPVRAGPNVNCFVSLSGVTDNAIRRESTGRHPAKGSRSRKGK
jgi:hypothetical protein